MLHSIFRSCSSVVNESCFVSMMTDYCGYKVEIKSGQLGTIVGIVKSYDDDQIDLINGTVNGQDFPATHYAVQ